MVNFVGFYTEPQASGLVKQSFQKTRMFFATVGKLLKENMTSLCTEMGDRDSLTFSLYLSQQETRGCHCKQQNPRNHKEHKEPACF